MVSNDAAGTGKRGPAITIEDVEAISSPEKKDQPTAAEKPAKAAPAPGRAKGAAGKGASKPKGKAGAKGSGAAKAGGGAAKPGAVKPATAAKGEAKKKPAKPSSPIQRLSRIATAAVIVAVLAAGYGIYAHVTSAERYSIIEQEMASIVVATHDIQPGTQIGGGDVALREVPRAMVPSGATDKLENVIGTTATALIPGNAGVVSGNVANDKAATLAGRIDSDKVAITLTVNQQSGVAGLIHQGDHVTVLTGGTDGGEYAAVATHANVVSLDSNMDLYSNAYTSVTVEVSSAEAQAIAAAQARGNVTCVLEPASSL